MTGLNPLWMPVISVAYVGLLWIAHRWPHLYIWAISTVAIVLTGYVAWIEAGVWAGPITAAVAFAQIYATVSLIQEMRR